MRLNLILSSVRSRVREILHRSTYWFYTKKYAQTPGLVLFLSDSNDQLVGNQKAIAEELSVRGVRFETVLKRSLKERHSFREFRRLFCLLAQSPVIILDDFYPMIYALKLRPRTELLQVWHASGAFKTMGFSRTGKPGGPGPRSKAHRNYTSVIVSSPQIRHNWAEAFGIPIDRVHATGIPRTDPFFDTAFVDRTATQVRVSLGLSDSKKLILFAPTFRGNGQLTAHYNFEWIDWKELADQLGDEYVFGVKMHPFVSDTQPDLFRDERFFDLTRFTDTNALLMAADILITDYSSIIFDFSLLRKPVIFFCPDLDEYVASRDFYYPFSEYTYGPVARSSEELTSALNSVESIDSDLTKFLDQFTGACDGKSTQRVVEEIILPATWTKK